jgi:hypothetical protein
VCVCVGGGVMYRRSWGVRLVVDLLVACHWQIKQSADVSSACRARENKAVCRCEQRRTRERIACTHTHTRAHTHTHTHTRARARTHTRTHTHVQRNALLSPYHAAHLTHDAHKVTLAHNAIAVRVCKFEHLCCVHRNPSGLGQSNKARLAQQRDERIG